MNLDEIDELGKSVTNEAQARSACLVKWRGVKDHIDELDNWITRTCGFCHLADKLSGIYRRCDSCPKKVREFCDMLTDPMSILVMQIQAKAAEVITFLNAYEVTDDSVEVPS